MSEQDYGGIFWVRADGGWRSATPGEALDEIKRLRDALREIAEKAATPGYAPEQCRSIWWMARIALDPDAAR